METRISGNLERQAPLDQSNLGPFDTLGPFSVALGIDLGKVNADEVEGDRVALEGVEY